MDGGHQRFSRRWNCTPGGVHQIRAPSQSIDQWPVKTVPGFVKDAARQERVDDLYRGPEVPGRRLSVTSSKSNQFYVSTVVQRPGQAYRGHRCTSRNRVPALLQEVGDADGIHRHLISRIAAHRVDGRQSHAPTSSGKSLRPAPGPRCVVDPHREPPLYG